MPLDSTINGFFLPFQSSQVAHQEFVRQSNDVLNIREVNDTHQGIQHRGTEYDRFPLLP